MVKLPTDFWGLRNELRMAEPRGAPIAQRADRRFNRRSVGCATVGSIGKNISKSYSARRPE